MDDLNKTNYFSASHSSDRVFMCAPDIASPPVIKNTAKEKLICNQVQNIKNVYQQNGNLICINIQHIPNQTQTKQIMTNPQNHSPVKNNVTRLPENVTLKNTNLIYVNNQENSTMELNRQSLRTIDTLIEVNPAIVRNTEDNTIIKIDVDQDPISTLNTSVESHTIIDVIDNGNGSRKNPDLMIEVIPEIVTITDDNTIINNYINADPISTLNASAESHTIIPITVDGNGSRKNPNLIIEVNPRIVKNTDDNKVINNYIDEDPISTLNASEKSHDIINVTENENNSRQDPDLMIVNIQDNKETQTIIDLTNNDDLFYEMMNSKNKILDITSGSLLTDDDMLCEKYYKDVSELAVMNATPEINIDYLLNDINIDEIVEALNECNANDQSDNNDIDFVKGSTTVLIHLENSQSSVNQNLNIGEPLDSGEKLPCIPITQLDTCNLSQSKGKLNATSSSQAVKDTKLHTNNHKEKLVGPTRSQQVPGQNIQKRKSRNSEKITATPSSWSHSDIPSNCNEKLNAIPIEISKSKKHTSKTFNAHENLPAPSSQSDLGKTTYFKEQLNGTPTLQSDTPVATDKPSKSNEKLNADPISLSKKGRNIHTNKFVNTSEILTATSSSRSHKYNSSNSNKKPNAAPTSLSDTGKPSKIIEPLNANKGSNVHTNQSLYACEKITTATSSRTEKGKPYCNEKLNPAPNSILENRQNMHTINTINTGEKLTIAPRPQVKHQQLQSKHVNRGVKLTPPSSQPIIGQNIHTSKSFHSGEKSSIGADSQPVKKPYTTLPIIHKKMSALPNSLQKKKFEEAKISPSFQTTTVPKVHISESKKYNNNPVKDKNLHIQKSTHKIQISVKTPKHKYVRITTKKTLKKESLIATQNSHQVITKDTRLEKIANNMESTPHNIKNKSNIATKNTFGAIINSKEALKNYVIPKIRKNMGQITLLTKNKPTINNIDFDQSHGKGLIIANLNEQNKCKDEQSENSYCELSLIRDEINKFMSCRNEFNSVDGIDENKVEICNTKVYENTMKILCCNDKNKRLYETECDGEKNVKYIHKKQKHDPRAGIANKNELTESLPQNDRKRKYIDINENNNDERSTGFKLKFQNTSVIKKKLNSIDTKGRVMECPHINQIKYNDGRSTENTQTNANKIGQYKLNNETNEVSEMMINLEDGTSNIPKYILPPKKLCTTNTIPKNDVKLLNEIYAEGRDNETNNPSTAHQQSEEKTSSEDKQSDLFFDKVTIKHNSSSTIKSVKRLKSLKNLSNKRPSGSSDNRNTTPKGKNSISHKEFIALIPTSSRENISSIKLPCANKVANTVNKSLCEITEQEISRFKLVKQNTGQTESNFNSILHSSLVSRYNIDNVLYVGQHSYILKARNKSDNRMVAVKILLKMSFLESQHIEILRKLDDADKSKYFSCIESKEIFWARHWCITMEYYPLNLIQALSSCGTGLTIDKVQQLSWQLLTALLMLRVTQILHTDIKPSHILINAEHTRLKLTGFDEAMYEKELEVSPHIGTLNYRSPEIFLGIKISYPADVWSTACTMFEMATKQKLFEGVDNHSVLENIMCHRGMLSDQLLSEGIFSEDSNWKHVKKLTGNKILNKLFNVYNSSISQSTNECRKIIMFSDLLGSMLALNHSERKTVELAYVHPFISKPQ